MRARIWIALAASLALAGCASSTTTTASPSPPAARPASPAKLKILEPAAGAVLPPGMIHIKLDLQQAAIVPVTTKAIRPGEGHVHLSLDGQIVSMTFGLEQDVNAAPGRHLIQAEFVAGDHFPFDPRVIATTTFEVHP